MAYGRVFNKVRSALSLLYLSRVNIATWIDHFNTAIISKGISAGKGQNTYLDSDFEIDGEKFFSRDRGRDLETDEQIWGSVAGPFHFVPLQSFADEVKV